jgi:hypothetical protein
VAGTKRALLLARDVLYIVSRNHHVQCQQGLAFVDRWGRGCKTDTLSCMSWLSIMRNWDMHTSIAMHDWRECCTTVFRAFKIMLGLYRSLVLQALCCYYSVDHAH